MSISEEEQERERARIIDDMKKNGKHIIGLYRSDKGIHGFNIGKSDESMMYGMAIVIEQLHEALITSMTEAVGEERLQDNLMKMRREFKKHVQVLHDQEEIVDKED